MKLRYKSILFIAFFLFFCFINQSKAQKSGVSGYGKTELIYVGADLEGDIYLGAGGGILVNDNFLFGVYLRALNKPYKYDIFEISQDTLFGAFEEHPFSLNENAISSTAGNIETGLNLGFNIMPDKPFQITFTGKMGLNVVSFSEISAVEDPNSSLGVVFEDDLYTMFGFNSSLEINLQFKIGGFLKMGAIGGYHFAVINGRTRNGPILKIPTMFSGPYIGASILFGSF